MSGKEIFLQKIIMEKNKQFDNLMKYSITKDEKYLKKIEEFYQIIYGVDMGFKYGLFTDLLEEFNSCISEDESNTIVNIVDLYARTYLQIENINKRFCDTNYEKLEGAEENISNKYGDKQILVIDDDKLLLKLIKKSMEEEGYNPILCSNPLSAIEILKEREISLIVLDMILPNIDGFQITKIIREIDPLVPMIIISERDDIETKINVLKMGADDYITKPINMKELCARIDRALDRSNNYNIFSIEDGLTGVYTKEYFWDRVSEQKAFYNRNKKIFSIAFIDLDNFKKINDNLGHLIGDQILKCFAQTLKNVLRSTDLIFRFGGDEFIVIFPETRENDAKLVMERFKILEKCKHCHKESCFTLNNLKFSAGITEIKGENDIVENIIERADKALYEAKAAGRDKIFIYNRLKN